MMTADQGICERHGQPRDFNLAGRRFGCSGCRAERDAARAVEAAAEAAREAERRDARRRAWLEDAMAQSGLHGRLTAYTFGTFNPGTPEQARALAACRALADDLSAWDAGAAGPGWRPIVLIGPPGTGKTHLLSASVSASIATFRNATYTTVGAYIRRTRATWQRAAATETEEAVLDDFAGHALVALDEAGLRDYGPTDLAALGELIDALYVAGSRLLLASNLTWPALCAALGERTADRLAENALVLPVSGPSRAERSRTR